METHELKETIRDELDQAFNEFIFYARKLDKQLPVGAIERAISEGIISTQELADQFKTNLDNLIRKRKLTIAIGSTNKSKAKAVEYACTQHELWRNGELLRCNVESGVNPQPKSLEESLRGARNRAQAAFHSERCHYGIGLESGIFSVPVLDSLQWFDTTACAIYDGHKYFYGFSSAFRTPDAIIDLILNKGLEVTTAALELGWENDENFKQEHGFIGLLTKNKLKRAQYTYQAIEMAFIELENGKLYEPQRSTP